MSGIAKFRKSIARFLVILLIMANATGLQAHEASAFTSADADAAINSFNDVFYSASDGKGIYKYYDNEGVADFWRFAEMIEMVEDAYDRSGNTAYKAMVGELYDGFTTQYGTDWTNNGFNDDLMWMVLACARAYEITGDTKYADQAKYHFDQVYARGWDDVMGGGIWWTTDKTCKNSCINSPAVIAATMLYEIYNDSSYLDKARNIFAWERNTLFNTANGAIWDSIHNDSTGLDKGSSTYNQGTFIGAANELYRITGTQSYYDDALKALEYTKRSLTAGGILVSEKYTSDAGGFKGIFCRWAMKFIKDNGLSAYQAWMQDNANRAWSNRRAADNIMDQDFSASTPEGTMSSWFCSSAVVLLQVCPPGEGSGNRYATAKTEAEDFDSKSGMVTESCPEGGQQLGGIFDGTYAVYNHMDMDGISSFQARIATDSTCGGFIEIRLDSPEGTLLGKCNVFATGGYSSFVTVSCPIDTASGVHDLYLIFRTAEERPYVCNLNWFQFLNSYKSAYGQLEAESCNESSGVQGGACVEGGRQLGWITNGSYALYRNIDFGSTGASVFRGRVALDSSAGGSIEIHMDSPEGTLIGTCSVSDTGGWSEFETVSTTITPTIGVHDIYLVFKTAQGVSYVCDFNWFTFQASLEEAGTKPAMGWNSYDCYGSRVREQEVRDNADYMADYLKEYGWEYIVIDANWSQQDSSLGTSGWKEKHPAWLMNMDEYGRQLPDDARFPSTGADQGFKALADYVHSKGLKFGIHIMRGIPRQAVEENTPIYGTDYYAADIADTDSVCDWGDTSMYGIDMSKPGAQEYLDSMFMLYASWGCDYIKIDDLTRTYHAPEVEGYRNAITNCGREMIYSGSPGQTPLSQADHVTVNCNSWRIEDDLWDNWGSVSRNLGVWPGWFQYIGENHYPDNDMLPFGRLSKRGPGFGAENRWTGLTEDEQYTAMTMAVMGCSPLIFGGNLPENDAFTNSLLTNTAVINVNQNSENVKSMDTGEYPVWCSTAIGSTDKYLAVFNTTDAAAGVPVKLSDAGINSATCTIVDLWTGSSLGEFGNTFTASVNGHGAGLYKISWTPVAPADHVYEAEAPGNTLTGKAVITEGSNFSGGNYVGMIGGGSINSLQFNNVIAPADGSYYIQIDYATDGNRTASLSVNGAAATLEEFSSTGSFSSVGSKMISVALKEGINTIKLSNDTGYAPDIDRLIFTGLASGGTYHISAKSSSKAITVFNNETENGSSIIQYTYNGGNNQKWVLEDVGEGYVKLTNANSGKVLDVYNNSLENGAKVIQYTYLGGDNQKWKLESLGGGYYKIVNVNSGKVLNVSGNSIDDGADIIQFTWENTDNEKWLITEE